MTKEYIRKNDIEEEFETFWTSIIMENGKLNLDQLKKELYDYSMLLQNIPQIYDEVTGGKISKPNTSPLEVIASFNDFVNEAINLAIEEYKQMKG